MASTDKKKVKITESSKQANVDITSKTIILPADSADQVLVAKVPSAANCTSGVNVEVEMSPDGTNWCPALRKEVVTTAGSSTSAIVGNEKYVDLQKKAPVYNSYAKGALNFDTSGNTVALGTGTRDLLDQHIAVDKSFNYSMWVKSDTLPHIASDETVTFTVTVAGGKFYIDGVEKANVYLKEGSTYTFDQSDASNSNHPLRFSTTDNGTHGGGVEYTGVTIVGTPGTAGAYTRITVPEDSVNLYYYCANHSLMGGNAYTPIPTDYKPVLFRHGGYDNFTNNKVAELQATSTQTLNSGAIEATTSGYVYDQKAILAHDDSTFDLTAKVWSYSFWFKSNTNIGAGNKADHGGSNYANVPFTRHLMASTFKASSFYGGFAIQISDNSDQNIYPGSSMIVEMVENGSKGHFERVTWDVGASLYDGNWHHMMVVRETENPNPATSTGMKIYIDGSLASTTFSAFGNNTNPPTFANVVDKATIVAGQGHKRDASGSLISGAHSARYYSSSFLSVGKIDNIAFWKSDQSANILDIYNGGKPPTTLPGSPTSHLRFEDSSNLALNSVTGSTLSTDTSDYTTFNVQQEVLTASDSIYVAAKATQNLTVPKPFINRYDGYMSPNLTSTVSELSYDFLYTLAPNKDWTWISLDDGVSTGSGTPNDGPGSFDSNLDTISFRLRGPNVTGRYVADRLYVSSGFTGYVSSSSAAATALGSMVSGTTFTVYPNATPAASIKYISPSEIDQALIMVATNTFNSSTNIATMTVRCYNKQTGSLIHSRVFTTNAMTTDQIGFFDGTATVNLSTLGWNTSNNYLSWVPLSMDGVHNLILNKYLPDQAAIDNYVVPSADGGIDIIQDTSGDSDVIGHYKMGNGVNDSVTGTLTTKNEAGATTAFPDFTMYSVRDIQGSTNSHDDGLATQTPALNDIFSMSSNLSISGWFKTTDTGTLFSNTGGAAATGMSCEITTSSIGIKFQDGVPSPIVPMTDVNDGEWHHIVVTKNTSQEFKIYIDGNVRITQTPSGITNADLNGSNGFTLLGDGQNNAHVTSPSNTDSSKLNATLSNWSIHNEVLDVNAVAQLYSNGHVRNIKNLPSVNANSIKGWWQLNNQSNPLQDSVSTNNLIYQSAAGLPNISSELVDATGATLVEKTINGNAITLSLTKSFNFTTKEWSQLAGEETALCLSLNGFEEQAEYFALWKCAQTLPDGPVDICDGNWHNIALSYRGQNDLSGDNVAEGDVVRFGVGSANNPFNFSLAIDGYPLYTEIGNNTGADYIGGLNTLITDTISSVTYNVGFNIYNRHLRYEPSNTEEEYRVHGQFGPGVHTYIIYENDPHSFRGEVDETSFHSDSWWANSDGTNIGLSGSLAFKRGNLFNKEKTYTLYGRTSALDTRGAGKTPYAQGIPYPLLNPELLKSSGNITDIVGTNQFLNPVRKGDTQSWNSQVSTGGLEGWWRWGDTSGDCSLTVNDVKDHNSNDNFRDIDAVELTDQGTANNVVLSSVTNESIYLQSQAAQQGSGSASTQFNQIKLQDLSTLVGTTACAVKDFVSPVLQYLRIKLTGSGSCDIGEGKLEIEVNYKKRRMK